MKFSPTKKTLDFIADLKSQLEKDPSAIHHRLCLHFLTREMERIGKHHKDYVPLSEFRVTLRRMLLGAIRKEAKIFTTPKEGLQLQMIVSSLLQEERLKFWRLFHQIIERFAMIGFDLTLRTNDNGEQEARKMFISGTRNFSGGVILPLRFEISVPVDDHNHAYITYTL